MKYEESVRAIAPMLGNGVVYQSELLGHDTWFMPGSPVYDRVKKRWKVLAPRLIEGVNIPKCDDYEKSLIHIRDGKIVPPPEYLIKQLMGALQAASYDLAEEVRAGGKIPTELQPLAEALQAARNAGYSV